MVMMMTMMMATMMMMVVMVMMVKTFGTETLDIAPQRLILMNSPSKQGNKLGSKQGKNQKNQNKEKSSDQYRESIKTIKTRKKAWIKRRQTILGATA